MPVTAHEKDKGIVLACLYLLYIAADPLDSERGGHWILAEALFEGNRIRIRICDSSPGMGNRSYWYDGHVGFAIENFEEVERVPTVAQMGPLRIVLNVVRNEGNECITRALAGTVQ
jgi:hypothetical protein